MSWRGLYWQGNIFFAFETPQCTLSLNEVCRYDWRFFNSDPRMLCSLKVLSACPLHSGFGSRLFPGTNPTVHSNFWARSTSRNSYRRRGESGKVISCDGNMNIKGLVCSFENSTGVGDGGSFVLFLCFCTFQNSTRIATWWFTNAKVHWKGWHWQAVSRLQVRPHAWPCPLYKEARLTCALMTPYCKLMTSSPKLLSLPLPAFQAHLSVEGGLNLGWVGPSAPIPSRTNFSQNNLKRKWL